MKLSQEQIQAASHLQGPALTLAIPGAGKTTILLHRIINLLKYGVEPNKILTITFSKAQSLDIAKRFDLLYPNSKIKPEFSTIHSFCYKILLLYSKIRGKTFKLIEEKPSAKYRLILNLYFEINKINLSEDSLEKIINKISYFKNSMIDPKDSKTKIPGFIEIYEKYENYKEKNNLIDFDDMIIYALKILKSDNYLLRKIRSKYEYIQLDEGQDTSISQFELIDLISSPKHNLFIVADDDQSIYAFRGANPQYLLHLKDKYQNLKFYYLSNNYRSSKNIVSASNLFISKNKNRYNKKISTHNEYKNPVNIIKVSTNSEQYEFIYENLLQNKNQTHAVIYRNNLSSLSLVEYLERKNVKFNIRGSKLKFFSHFIVQDILNIISFSQDQKNIDTFSKIYYKIKGYISKKHLDFIKNNSGTNIFKTLLEYPGLNEFYKNNIFELASDFNKLKRLNIHQQIEFVFYNLNYNKYLRDVANKFNYNYEELKEFYYQLKFIAKLEKSLESLLGRLSHLEYLISTKSYANSNLSISTIHSVKGLEYDCVYVIDLTDDIIPGTNSDKDFDEYQEQRRLFYVAMTRARENLYLMYPKTFNGTPKPMSSFLEEISNM
ncbi:DNA helicase II [Peptoniphilus sp. ING2-D1G]|nr:DNA helicase II [Peptoniphilus sp. ING2-D1G]